MAHPTNKFDRFEIGRRKGMKRAGVIWDRQTPEARVRFKAERIKDEHRGRTVTTLWGGTTISYRRSRGLSIRELRADEATHQELRTMLIEPKPSVVEPDWDKLAEEEEVRDLVDHGIVLG